MEVTAEEIFEITDSSINVESLVETSKRRYPDDLEDGESEDLSSKKFKEETSKIELECDGNDITTSFDVTNNETVVKESSQPEDDENISEIVVDQTVEVSNLDKSAESESMLEEIESDGEKNIVDDDEDVLEDNGHTINSDDSEIEEEEIDDEESDNTSDDDDAIMMRAMNASKTVTATIENDDEPIALDSSDSDMSEVEEEIEEEPNSSMYERNNPFPYSFRTRMLRYSPRIYIAQKLLKRSIKIINSKPPKKETLSEEVVVENITEEITVESKESTEIKTADVPEEKENSCDQELPKEEEEKSKSPQPVLEVAEPMQVDEVPAKDEVPAVKISDQKTNDEAKVENKSADQTISEQEGEELSLLLTEISKSNIDDVMNRYVFNSTDNNQQSVVPAAMEEFAEKLFICLQQNKHDIQKAQQIWNEKLHTKYKIREMMERIRRHRAVVDIESFGYKPAHDNPIVSSKSSTTNSENDHFEKASRMSSESVSRLIQDVRANVLKRDEKQQHMENHINESFDESNPFAHLQNQGQGRQGQIIDVQSIINDFRQKNPQEIPRRGRRFKNSFGGHSSIMENQGQSPFNARMNESFKNNSQGFPEVSLLPVNSFYKSLSQSNSPYGQKSSLLQSILTKSTKSPVGLQHMNNNTSGTTSSTLARLLTAPERERTLQNTTPRSQMAMGGSNRQSNGEITITPIQPGTSRKHEYSMEENENSMDGHLVIDESDFDISDRKSDLLLCQGCRRHKALFMCAGCSKQWYCSKECQELAWDDHAESCMV